MINIKPGSHLRLWAIHPDLDIASPDLGGSPKKVQQKFCKKEKSFYFLCEPPHMLHLSVLWLKFKKNPTSSVIIAYHAYVFQVYTVGSFHNPSKFYTNGIGSTTMQGYLLYKPYKP